VLFITCGVQLEKIAAQAVIGDLYDEPDLTARAEQLGDNRQKMNNKYQYGLHVTYRLSESPPTTRLRYQLI
jgi:hypothetical protein